MFIDDDLKWSTHVDYIYKKACKRLYSLRLLRRAGVPTTGMLKAYLSVIRPILEYAVPVWQSICEMQSEKLESIQKRALRVIFPTAETYDALNLAGLETLASRTHLCEKYMNKMRCTNHPLNMLLPRRYEKNFDTNDSDINFILLQRRFDASGIIFKLQVRTIRITFTFN